MRMRTRKRTKTRKKTRKSRFVPADRKSRNAPDRQLLWKRTTRKTSQ